MGAWPWARHTTHNKPLTHNAKPACYCGTVLGRTPHCPAHFYYYVVHTCIRFRVPSFMLRSVSTMPRQSARTVTAPPLTRAVLTTHHSPQANHGPLVAQEHRRQTNKRASTHKKRIVQSGHTETCSSVPPRVLPPRERSSEGGCGAGFSLAGFSSSRWKKPGV